jgi:hypothetical protein
MTPAEMDRRAAEGVMGWEWTEPLHDIPYWWDADNCITVFDWSPTTNEAHAALVRERMIEKGWLFFAHRLRREPHEVEFLVANKRGKFFHESFPYALTSAALLACGLATEEEIDA